MDKSLWKSLKKGAVSVEIINAAPQGDGGSPDAENDAGNEGKDRNPEHQKQENENHLADGFDLSEGTRGDDLLTRHGDQAKTVDAQFPGQNQHNHPRGQKSQVDQHDHRGKHEELIRHGINEFAEIGDLLVFSGQMPVEIIREAGEGKKEHGGPSCRSGRKIEQQDNNRNT